MIVGQDVDIAALIPFTSAVMPSVKGLSANTKNGR